MKEIDARRLACPAPVLLARDLVEKENPGVICISVDNDAAKQNVMRFLESRDYKIAVDKAGDVFRVTGQRDHGSQTPASAEERSAPPERAEKKVMVMITTDRIGFGDDELGKKLMISFLKTCGEMGQELWRLVFINNGVKLTVSGSSVLPELAALEKEGITILVCGTCLTHFDLMDQKRVGQTTNMLDIVTAMQLADKVINF